MQTLQGIANNNWSHRDGWSAENAHWCCSWCARRRLRKLARSGRPSDISEEEALKKLLADKTFMRQLREDKTRVQAGFLAIDPRTSAVLAWVGSRDYAQDAFDHVAQARRQPGSTFKPFVYGAALQRGARPDDTRKDEAVEIQLPGGEVWRPSDAVEPTGVPMKLSDALAYSKNTITAELGQEVGMDRVIKLARALGVRQSPLEPVPSLALGSSPSRCWKWSTPTAALPTPATTFRPSWSPVSRMPTASCWPNSPRPSPIRSGTRKKTTVCWR
jgi:penicillin-binding protein 1A